MQGKPDHIEIFVKDGCPYCAGLRRKLQSDGMPFVEYDVRRDMGAMKRMLELNGGRRLVPTWVVDGEATVGFQGT
jgi:glutaredoxin